METPYKIALVLLFGLLLLNLGQALWFMLNERAGKQRSPQRLLLRSLASLLLIALVIAALWLGWIHPRGHA